MRDSHYKSRLRRAALRFARLAAAATLVVTASAAIAQTPILSVSPGDKVQTIAGNGTASFSGDGGAATSASLFLPTAIAVATDGTIYIADTRNNRIRRIDTSGNISTVAGDGNQGFAGDGGPAVAAELNEPEGIAVDTNGTLYISDTENNRIRVVQGGVITTLAGNGTAAYSGDGSAATSASLDHPTGITVDANGNVYVADTDNHAVREVSSGTITTVAGNGVQGFSGDGGSAVSASLDTPLGIVLDASGSLYVADSHNNRVRVVSRGVINTFAGTGSAGYSGDGGAATGAALDDPAGVSVGSDGAVYIADANDQSIRRVLGGVISTVAGNALQGYSGDNQSPNSATLDVPFGIAVMHGSLLIADRENQVIRAISSSTLSFGNQTVGTAGSAQSITLTNSGSGTLNVASVQMPSGDYTVAGSSTCGTSLPFTIAANSSCKLDVVFQPVAVGATKGEITITDNAPGSPQVVRVNGSGVQDGTSVSLSSSASTSTYGNSITLTAQINPVNATSAATPSGTVTFSEGGNTLSTATVTGGKATFTTTLLAAGTHNITAAYSGDTNYTASSNSTSQVITSAVLTVTAADATMTYGSSVPPLTYGITGFANGDTAGTAVTGAPALSVSSTDAGTQTVVIGAGTLAASNYTFAFVNGKLTVNKAALSVTVDDKSMTYGGTVPTFTGTVTGAAAADAITVSYSSTGNSTTVVGPYPIVAALNDPNNRLANYTVTNTPATLTIGKAALTVTPADVSRQYGVANPVFTGTVSGVVNNDGITATYSTTAVTLSDAGTYPITAAIVDPNSRASNYSVTLNTGTLTVTQTGSTVSLVSSVANANLHANIVFTSTVASTTSGTPTGTVSFFDGTTDIGTSTLTNGVATFTTNALIAGIHSMTAQYEGDVNFPVSTSTALSQQVTAPDFSIVANPTSLVIKRGSSGTVTLTVTPVGGFTGNVNFGCSGLPAYVACTFTPPLLNLTGDNRTQLVTLVVTTPGATAALIPPGSSGKLFAATTWTSFGTFGLLLIGGRPRSKRTKRAAIVVLAIVLLAMMMALSGCGAGSCCSVPSPPLGTTTATVTASAAASGSGTGGGIQHSANVTITITN